jgi:hypothetical protein
MNLPPTKAPVQPERKEVPMQRFFGHRPSGLRLYLFTALAAAFLLVPAAQAFAEGDGHIVFEGEGSGWVKGIEPGEPGEGGEPNIECHWTGTEIDVGTSPAEGSGVPGLHTCDTNLHVGFVGKALNVKRELGPITVWGGWEVQPGEGTPIVCSPEFTTCSAIGSPITIKATFNPEPVPPSNVTPPTVTGPAKEGKTEHGNAGTWSGGPESYTYQWWRCDAAGENCVEISGAESTEYTATSEDVGSTLRFEDTATIGLGRIRRDPSGRRSCRRLLRRLQRRRSLRRSAADDEPRVGLQRSLPGTVPPGCGCELQRIVRRDGDQHRRRNFADGRR